MPDDTPNANDLASLKASISKIIGKDLTGKQGTPSRSPTLATTALRVASPPPLAASTTSPSQTKRPLEDRFVKGAPELAKHAKTLSGVMKKISFQNTVAKITLVLDISGSMGGQYRDGSVQQIINRALPIAVQLSDNGQLELWYYGSRASRMSPVNLANYKSAIPGNWETLMESLGYGNDEPQVMRPLMSEFKMSRIPAYILFITDGGVSASSEIKNLIDESSKYPIFWQFVGIGGSNYGTLQGLDHSSKNASFFALDDFKSILDEELYGRLLAKFQIWLRQR